jgi:hypothetical protein
VSDDDAKTGHRFQVKPDEASGACYARTEPAIEFVVFPAANGAQLVHLTRFFSDEQERDQNA